MCPDRRIIVILNVLLCSPVPQPQSTPVWTPMCPLFHFMYIYEVYSEVCCLSMCYTPVLNIIFETLCFGLSVFVFSWLFFDVLYCCLNYFLFLKTRDSRLFTSYTQTDVRWAEYFKCQWLGPCQSSRTLPLIAGKFIQSLLILSLPFFIIYPFYLCVTSA